MRLSFMTFACPQWTFDEVLAAARRHGYEGIEPRLDSGHAHGLEVALDAAGRRRVREQAAAAGVELCCLATSLQFIHTEPAARAKLADEAAARIALAADLGVPGLRVFGGPLPPGVGLAEGVAAAGQNLRAAGEVAAAAGVELWVETHDTLSRGVDCAAAVAAAGHPAVAVNWDVMHPYRHGEPLETTLTALAGRIRHAHWHDALARADTVAIVPFGAGELPLEAMLAALVAAGYTGYLSGEWFGDQLGAPPEVALGHFATATRGLLESGARGR